MTDISSLLAFRDAPQQSKPLVRALVGEKLDEITHQIEELRALHEELASLAAACEKAHNHCPILDDFNKSQNKK